MNLTVCPRCGRVTRTGAPTAAHQRRCEAEACPWTRDDCLRHHHISGDQFYCVRCHARWAETLPVEPLLAMQPALI